MEVEGALYQGQARVVPQPPQYLPNAMLFRQVSSIGLSHIALLTSRSLKFQPLRLLAQLLPISSQESS